MFYTIFYGNKILGWHYNVICGKLTGARFTLWDIGSRYEHIYTVTRCPTATTHIFSEIAHTIAYAHHIVFRRPETAVYLGRTLCRCI